MGLVAIGVSASARTIVVNNPAPSQGDQALERREVELRTVTAYSELDSCHTGPDCLMANGKRAEVGYVACPRSLALGTIVELQGISYECGDRTAKRYDGRYDVFMGYGVEAHTKALAFGKRSVEVSIIK